ncbi:MAG: hypothetical protein ACPKNR_10905 [Pleomorphochaeta sp.]
MKKKILLLVALMGLVLVPTFAKSSDMSAGLALGTINGVGFKYNLDKDLTLGGTLGLDVVTTGTLSVEAFGLYKVAEVEVQKENFDINAGGGVAASFINDFNFSVLGMVEASYSFKGDYPIDLLLRLEPGYTFGKAFVMHGSIQGLWRL